ncbi:YdeI/OmpD-associated family protein [Pedobacter soli]|uniref:Bacteriocin-protection, YdeI or OmpD-Associated n=1 Tax=Pedobacter soli TaxID=390242 RepID=A0A1G6IY21_9SPHI|nr:YdeI/OmpD-associated family protein [Pedobacter soli]SDC11384.1 Bacteriocin-protection, YdeI or OmpD-Associated [Pedobacter soli]
MENSFLKKLQVKPGFKVKIVDAPENAAAIFGDIPADVVMQYQDTADFNALITFSTSKAQLNAQIKDNIGQMDTKTICWVFYPKKTSKIPSDLELMKSWEELSGFGLTPCASAAVNETWTALRLKFISEVKPSGMRNDHIKTNEFGEYIDPVNKTVKLPEDLQTLLAAHTEAYAYFNTLAYSHKKEYVLWILTAKQEKTRTSRLEKTIEMLLNKKKNPSDK